MSDTHDKKLGMDRPITRRDFLNGVAVGVGGAAASSLLPGINWATDPSFASLQDQPGYCPPALTGMRGSHAGSFEAAHALRDGTFWKHAGKTDKTGEIYDLVIVGGGISGLAAAHFWRKQNPAARILILDNHDDFGGHAKRNEFLPENRFLLANGGTWAIESPFPYSKVAHGLMDELGIDPPALAKKCYDQGVYNGLSFSVFFDNETFGADKLVAGLPGGFMGGGSAEDWKKFLAQTPLAAEVQRDIFHLETDPPDYLPELSSEEKKGKLSRISYRDFLLKMAKVHPGVIPFYQTRTHDLFGAGIDAVSALDCWALRLPGFKGMNLAPGPYRRMGYTPMGFVTPKPPYSFHFPDGNATIARLLVQRLIPESVSVNSPEDMVTAKLDYSQLDKGDSGVRIRLSSTVLAAHHEGELASAKEVRVAYVQDKQVFTVRGKAVVMACWNMMIPYLCPELPQQQKEALHYGVKVPLVYTSVAIRNWKAFEKLGVDYVFCPGMYHFELNLDLPVDIGEYKASKSPDQPILVRMTRTPCLPGLSERDQHRAGRGEMLTATFETFERKIRDQLARVLAPGGFDPARDIQAITVNRWPHGYAYEYNPLFDPDWPPGHEPCEIARKRFGRIAIANSDAGAAAYTDSAIDQAYRAVQELLNS
jgi:spermidine dehydrogenase